MCVRNPDSYRRMNRSSEIALWPQCCLVTVRPACV
jgi:hypothetical protein